MTIWAAEIKELEKFISSNKKQFPGILNELEQLIKTEDANVVLLYSRRCLEVIVTDLCETELNRPRKTEPLKGIIDKLNSEEKVASHIISSMLSLNSMSTFGTHPKDFDPEQVKPVLNNLAIIIRWYIKFKSGTIIENDLRGNNTKTDSEKYKRNSHNDSSKTLISQNKKLIFYLSGFLLGIFLIAAAVLYFISTGNENPAKVKVALEKTICVLPFENQLDNQEYLWLGDALTDEIIMQLNNVEGFKVRPRSSVLKYKGTTKTHEEIGSELKVNYLIGGTVFRFNDSVRINIDLINAFTDTQQWSESFEGEWKDLLPMQRKIAKALAYKLKAVLSAEEISRIDKKMTDEPEAFKYYAQGNDLMMRSVEPKEFTIAMNLFEKAIEIDPEFCMAHMKLGMCYLQFYMFGGRDAEMLKKCKESFDYAFRIDPDIPKMPEAHFSLAQYYYYGFLNYDKALEEVGIAEKLSNYNLEYPAIKGAIYRRTGKWELAKENYIKAFEASSNNSAMAFYVAETLYLLGEYQEAEKYFKTASLIAPTFASSYWERINMYMKWKGNTIQGKETINEAFQFNELINDEKLFESNVLMDVYDGYYDKAISYISSKRIEVISTQFSFDLKSLLLARIYNLKNLPDKAHSYFDSARIDIESRILKSPDDSRLFSALGIACAGLGQKGNAIALGAKAVELMPFDKDAYFAAYREEDLARIFVMVGEYDQALDKIKLLLSRPGPLSVKLLLLDPTWKPLWEIPEFRKIVRRAPSDNSRI